MASSSVLKMAAALMLALFAGQLLMAAPTTGAYSGPPMDLEQCNRPPAGYTCKIVCFKAEFAVCVAKLLSFDCKVYAINTCKLVITN